MKRLNSQISQIAVSFPVLLHSISSGHMPCESPKCYFRFTCAILILMQQGGKKHKLANVLYNNTAGVRNKTKYYIKSEHILISSKALYTRNVLTWCVTDERPSARRDSRIPLIQWPSPSLPCTKIGWVSPSAFISNDNTRSEFLLRTSPCEHKKQEIRRVGKIGIHSLTKHPISLQLHDYLTIIQFTLTIIAQA